MNIARVRFTLKSKGEIGVSDMVKWIIFIVMLVAVILIILAISGQLDIFTSKFNAPIFKDMLK